MKKSKNTDNLIPIVFFLGLIAIWEIVCDLSGIEGYILPSPRNIVIAFFSQFTIVWPHLLVTVKEASFGFLLAVLLGILAAVIMDLSPLFKKAVYPLIVVSQTIPIIAIAPLFVIWFGFGMLPKIAVVVLVCFFPIAINLLDGFMSVDHDTLDLFKSMGAGKVRTFLMLKIPYASTNFFSGLKIAATYSVMGAIIGEWLGGEKGLGVYMMRVKNSFALDKMFAVVVLIVILSMALFKLLTVLEEVLTPWKTAQKKEKEEWS